MKRNRFIYFILMILTVALGLASRKYGAYLPEFVSKYVGDALWALMVYFGFGFLLNEKPIKIVFIAAIVFSFGIEISQLYQADWINEVRSTTIGALILGRGFLYSDLICYTFGALFGALLEYIYKMQYKAKRSFSTKN